MLTRTAPIALMTLLVACAGPTQQQPAGSAAPADTGAHDGLDRLALCPTASNDVQITDVAPTAVSTVLRVSWSAPQAGAGWLSWRDDQGQLHGVMAEGAGPDFSALVLGQPELTDLELVAGVDGDSGTACSAPMAVTTGPLDSGLPAVLLSQPGEGALEGGLLLIPVLSLEGVWATALDESGQIVWSWRLEVEDLPWMSPIFSVEPDPEGRGVYVNYQADRANGSGGLIRVGWDGEVISHVLVLGGHTDFALLPDGGFAMLGWELQMHAGRRILGDTIVEVAPDGSKSVLWRSFAHFPFDASQTYPHGFLPGDPDSEDWSHVNSLRYEPEQDLYLLTATLDDAVVAVDRQTGDSLWSLGTKLGDFDAPDGSILTEKPHSAALVGDDLLVFNRGAYDTGATCSRATQIALDFDARTSAETWGYQTDLCQRVTFLGDAMRLAGGNTVVTFSGAGLVDVASPAGETLWRAQTAVGAGFGFGHPVATLGRVERW